MSRTKGNTKKSNSVNTAFKRLLQIGKKNGTIRGNMEIPRMQEQKNEVFVEVNK